MDVPLIKFDQNRIQWRNVWTL